VDETEEIRARKKKNGKRVKLHMLKESKLLPKDIK